MFICFHCITSIITHTYIYTHFLVIYSRYILYSNIIYILDICTLVIQWWFVYHFVASYIRHFIAARNRCTEKKQQLRAALKTFIIHVVMFTVYKFSFVIHRISSHLSHCKLHLCLLCTKSPCPCAAEQGNRGSPMWLLPCVMPAPIPVLIPFLAFQILATWFVHKQLARSRWRHPRTVSSVPLLRGQCISPLLGHLHTVM